ncbi:MAG: LacI family DNA-binding transcriptional regulator [Brevinema sp.]
MTKKIEDVAKLAGVSVSTVSRVLNNSKNVRSELKIKVLQATKVLDYSINPMARSLKIAQTYTIAVVTTSIDRIFFIEILQEISRICKDKGYMVQILETNDDLLTEKKVIKMLHSQWVDGIILVSSMIKPNKADSKYIDSLGKLKKKDFLIPVVMLEMPALNPKNSSIVINHFDAAYKATMHLLEIGRKKIVHVALPETAPMAEDRINGFLDACDQYNIPQKNRIICRGDYSVLSGYKNIKQLIKSQIHFDAIFTGNDQMAVGCLRACKDHDLKIPKDVAIIGHDDVSLASLVEPALSTIRVPQSTIGILAINKLFELIEQPDTAIPEIISVDTELIVRESTMLSAKSTFDSLLKYS